MEKQPLERAAVFEKKLFHYHIFEKTIKFIINPIIKLKNDIQPILLAFSGSCDFIIQYKTKPIMGDIIARKYKMTVGILSKPLAVPLLAEGFCEPPPVLIVCVD